MKQLNEGLSVNIKTDRPVTFVARRNFLKSAGMTTIAGAIFLAGCDKDDDPVMAGDNVDLGMGDIGILNYAYALEQLEADFYIRVVDTIFSGATQKEKDMLMAIRDHEIVHREYLRNALGANAIGQLEFNFSAVDFTNRASVLGTARTFEDTGVSAYNGAGTLLKEAANLLMAGKIVSVEARHAAAIRSMLQANSTHFAGDDIINANGLDLSKKPSEVLPAVQSFIKNKLTGSSLPQS
ncbi:ferritin-like domain-containing protein [Emticicia sp. C21]|uniref:ferritin-like domain-containing protein n=1 Tax=Emticicia sp. C21 TaxID=2302915 RepID=UPI000E3418E6|nr:ferritin-like domain-containing protein [Emticicia sp. C21]RFS17532.1 ferritin-like domain-containing protein [Emticicia sp. C21]